MQSSPASRRAVVFSFLSVLVAVCAVVYGTMWWLSQGGLRSPLELISAHEAADKMGGFAEVVVAVLGVAITVVAILVELAATRYTPRITDLFVRDTVNVVVLGFFVVAAVLVVWLDVSGWPQDAALMRVAALGLISASLLALLPYFAYVFDFLSPTRVIRTVQLRAMRGVRRGRSSLAATVQHSKNEVLVQLDQLGDMALHAVDNNDKAIAIDAINAIADIVEAYLPLKTTLPSDWFSASRSMRGDQDFVAMHPDIIASIEGRCTWVEMKALRQLEAVFHDALNSGRDINHLIGIRARLLAHRARQCDDKHALTLALRFLNTYLRAAINDGDVHTAYNLYNELRLLGEDLMADGDGERLVELATRMKYYGQVAFHRELPFILETAAYDLCSLLVRASRSEDPRHDELLAIFLDVDREADSAEQVASLRGVRKAQVKLATHYLATGDRARARRIQEDMRHEPRERLRSIRAELSAITDPEYWEVSDRGINFDYVPPERREYLNAFFSYFEQGAA